MKNGSKDRTTVVSGASRGIGLELVSQLLRAGDRVHALARSPASSEGLKKLAADFPKSLVIHQVDVDSEDEVRRFASSLAGEVVDLLINNAGVYLDGHDSFEDLDLEKVMKSVATNAVGPMRLARALLPALKRSSQPRLANITSLMGSIGDNDSGGSYAYRMSKAALNMFTRSFAMDHPEISAAALHPGWVQTAMGGPSAPTPVEQSARGMLKVIAGLTPKASGNFYDFEGDELPW